jgi:hypothetical protein
VRHSSRRVNQSLQRMGAYAKFGDSASVKVHITIQALSPSFRFGLAFQCLL